MLKTFSLYGKDPLYMNYLVASSIHRFIFEQIFTEGLLYVLTVLNAGHTVVKIVIVASAHLCYLH